MSSTKTCVFYIVPEDGDDEEHPNFYTVARPLNKMRLGDVKTTFPLPGAYHFRFKKAFKSTFVWLDVTDDYEVVPTFEGSLFCKVSRLSSGPSSSSSGSNVATSSTTSVPVQSTSTPSSAAAPSRIKESDRVRAMEQKSSSGDLLGLGSSLPKSSNPIGATSSFSNAFDHKMMDLDWSTPSPSPSPPPSQGVPLSQNARSSSPAKALQPQQQRIPKQKVQIPADLSSAAKDFRL